MNLVFVGSVYLTEFFLILPFRGSLETNDKNAQEIWRFLEEKCPENVLNGLAFYFYTGYYSELLNINVNEFHRSVQDSCLSAFSKLLKKQQKIQNLFVEVR